MPETRNNPTKRTAGMQELTSRLKFMSAASEEVAA
jgi:hypothetical protein